MMLHICSDLSICPHVSRELPRFGPCLFHAPTFLRTVVRAPVCAHACCFVRVCAPYPSILGSSACACEAFRTMKRVFQKEDFEALAAKATLAAPADVLRRFYIPVCGTLTCAYTGAQTPEAQELVVYNTLVTFEWKLRGPRVQGTVSQTWEAHNAMRMLAGSGVPFRLKHPLVAAFLHVKLRSRKLLLAVLCTPSLSDDVHVRLHGIAMSKPIVEQFRKTIVNKRRRGTDMEAPICARISDTHSLACLPHEAGARSQFGLGRDKLRRVVDDGSTKPSTGMSAHAKRLDLPADLSAYDKRPWRCLRDAVAQAHFKAEAVLILKFGHQVYHSCLGIPEV